MREKHRCGNDFSAGGAKIGEKQSRQSNSKYNLIAICIFRESYIRCTMRSGAKHPSWEFLRIFALKETLQSVRSLLTKLQKNWGAGCITCSANNFVGEQLLSLPPPPPGSCAYGTDDAV